MAITGKRWIPTRVCFQHTESDDLSPYKAVLACSLAFDCPHNRLEFDSAVLDYPVLAGDAALHGVLARHADELLAKLPAMDNVIEQVRDQLSSSMRESEPSIEAVAEKLRMTPRTLQRRLKASDTTYKEVVDSLRKATAARYLTESQFGVSEISYLLGYSEPSAFHRAFRRWFDESPANYRLQCNSLPLHSH